MAKKRKTPLAEWLDMSPEDAAIHRELMSDVISELDGDEDEEWDIYRGTELYDDD